LTIHFSNEDKDEGFVINNADVGVRLKAFEYWKCAETGLYSEGSENSVKFVIAEALADQGKGEESSSSNGHSIIPLLPKSVGDF
jgi:hypothetical protein